MPALPDCDVCEFVDSPHVCYALARGHRPFCRMIREGRADIKALVHDKTLGLVPDEPGPSLARKVVNFMGAAATHVYHGMPLCKPDVKAARLAICEACTHFNPVNRSCTRPECGCAMDVKAGWADMRCPIDKWGVAPADA
jgi:hypothetical protein